MAGICTKGYLLTDHCELWEEECDERDKKVPGLNEVWLASVR